jgi:hypothetical protein
MSGLSNHLMAALAIFAVVFVLNVLPGFAPPTWTVLSFIAVRNDVNIMILSVVGAVAARSMRPA